MCGSPAACRSAGFPPPPSTSAAFVAFRERFPHVRVYAPWNEPNHRTQPTWNTPETGRGVHEHRGAPPPARAARSSSATCSTRPTPGLQQRPTYGAPRRWVQRYRAALRISRDVCGIHNYSDVNRFRTAGTRCPIRARLPAGLAHRDRRDHGLGWAGRAMAGARLRATRVPVPARRPRAPRITRVYVYTWFGRVTHAVGLRAGRAARGRDDDGPARALLLVHRLSRRRPRPSPPTTIAAPRSDDGGARRCGRGPRRKPPKRVLPESGSRRGRGPVTAASHRRC